IVWSRTGSVLSRFELSSVAAFQLIAATYAAALLIWVFLRGDRASGRGPFATAALPAAAALALSALHLGEPSVLALVLLAGAGVPALAVTSVSGPGAHDRSVALGYLLAAALAVWTLTGGHTQPYVIGFVALMAAWGGVLLGSAARRSRPGLNRARV